MIPEGWKKTSLSEIAIFLMGYAFRSCDFSGTGIPLIRMGNLYQNRLDLKRNPVYLPNSFIDSHQELIIKPGDILISMTGTMGKQDYGYAVLIPETLPLALLNQRVVKINSKNITSQEYLLHLLRSEPILKQIYNTPGGTKQANLSLTQLTGIVVDIPPLPEQRKIAEILSSWDKAIALLEQLITAKRKLKQGLMQQLLTGKKRFNEFEGSEWRNELLGDFMIVKDGVHKTPTYTKSGIPFLRVTDIQKDKVDLSNTKYISKEEHEKLTAKLKPQKGDILYSKNGTIGITRIIDWDWEFSFFVSLALLRFKKDGYSVQYFAQYLQSDLAKREIYQGSKQGSVINLHLEEIQKFRVPIPPLPEQQKIASILSTADAEISTLEKQLSAYKQQKRGLMQQLLTGKKRVKIEENN
jgi:type I restriction enzyme S subunit